MHLFICNRACEVYYATKTCENVNLDVDVTTGNGPETITLASQMPAPLDQTYVLWVCIFHVLTAKRKLERIQFSTSTLSKFDWPVVVNLKDIFELFGLFTTCFLI